ncbi:MAG: hypothetical protein CL927_01325 [Deltaproteobacteria bacterium]|nr:hypothetical protein [Deltaproteobacteria bacterium]
MLSTLPVAMWGLLGAAAATEGPTVTQLDGHRVRGTIEVDAALETVRAVLSDPRRIARIDNSGTTVTLKGRDGACLLTHSAVAHPIASIEYVTRVCPIHDGFKSTLHQSNDLTDFESIWRMRERGSRTIVEYEIVTIPDLPIPQFIVDRQTRSAVASLLLKLQTHFGSKPSPP